jgi:hypothetical protein
MILWLVRAAEFRQRLPNDRRIPKAFLVPGFDETATSQRKHA